VDIGAVATNEVCELLLLGSGDEELVVDISEPGVSVPSAMAVDDNHGDVESCSCGAGGFVLRDTVSWGIDSMLSSKSM